MQGEASAAPAGSLPAPPGTPFVADETKDDGAAFPEPPASVYAGPMDVQPLPRPAHSWKRRLAEWTRSGALPLVLALTASLGLWIAKDDAPSHGGEDVPVVERPMVEDPPRPTVDDLAEAYPMIDRSALEVIAEIEDARARVDLLEDARARFEAETRAETDLVPPGPAVGPGPVGGDTISPFDDGRDALGGLPPIEEQPDCGSNCWDDAPATGDAE